MQLKKLILIFLIFITSISHARAVLKPIAPYNTQNYDQEITNLYQQLPNTSNNISDRIDFFSRSFLNRPYELGALGEGKSGEFDQSPLYRTDKFDCVTYVEIVLALAEANNLSQFQKIIKRIRYKNGIVSFRQRNHFTSVDWNTNNAKNGYVKDITQHIRNAEGKPFAEMAKTIINKPNWYKFLKESSLKLLDPAEKNPQQLLETLHQQSQYVHAEKSIMPYLPLTKLFTPNGEAIPAIFKQIPDGAIIEIVRPNWQLEKVIGTNLNISHLGFSIWKDNQLYYREASSVEGKVINIPLAVYLKQYLESPTIKGIHVLKVLS